MLTSGIVNLGAGYEDVANVFEGVVSFVEGGNSSEYVSPPL